MRKVSEILQLMIDSGHYSEYRCQYMCHALEFALQEQVISADERAAAKAWIGDAIDINVKGHGTLYGYLLLQGIVADFSDLLCWYEDRIAELKAEGK